MNKSSKKLFGKALASALALSIGVCTVFGGMITTYAADCDHEFSDSWSSDSVNHWHASTCGHDIISDAEPHDFVEGKCAVCEAAQPAEKHVHTYNNLQWSSDDNNHWHASTCEHYILKDMEAHDFKDGKCTVCEKAQPQEKDPDPDPNPNPEPDPEPEPEPEKPVFTAVGSYSESLYAEFEATYSNGITASYKKSGDSSWSSVDAQLIRNIGSGKVRVDVVGIAAGTYSLKVNYTGGEIIKDNISVKAYDRSGYAHFGANAGVGAYDNDGIPKKNAQIIYVTEATKNTVKATIGGEEKEGIVAILGAAANSDNPLIIRVIGRISAATWKKGNVTYTKTTSNTVDGKTTGKLKEDAIVGKNGIKLPTTAEELTQEALIKGGYNELDTSKYSVLNGLSSKATYKDNEYDSCWNDCAINGAKNVTVEGIGTDAEIFQWGFTWSNCNSIEVRNLTFEDYTEDACSFQGSTNKTVASEFEFKNIWVHHNTFNRGVNYWDVCPEQDKKDGDGSIDLKRIANVTLSYNHFYDTHKTGLVGADDASCTANLTFHHNFYEECESRLPLARVANMHMYNNYYKGLGNTGTGLSIRAGGYAFVEYCYFENQHVPVAALEGTKTLENKKRQGFIKIYNCTFTNSSYDSSDYIKVATDRTSRYANDNIYNPYFDTDASAFYYDSANRKSNVTDLITNLTKIPVEIPKLAGVNTDK